MEPERRFDVVVVGAGPAGLAAAWAAAQGSVRVALVDENPALGGQIWRGESSAAHPRGTAASWLERVSRSTVTFLPGIRVIACPRPGLLLAESSDSGVSIRYERLILAPGARERFLPFPGWTLPNVMGAGGLQALVKSGLPIAGRRVVVGGSGPLLLAVAAYLRSKGAVIPLIAEQAPWPRLARFGLGLFGSPSKLIQAVQLKSSLGGVSYRAGSWPIAARGEQTLTSVTLTDGLRTWDEPCDYFACGFGLVPNTELPRLLGCALRGGFVAVDDLQRTSVEGVYCAGETTGIGGLDKSLVEGTIAGHVAAGRLDEARGHLRARACARGFVNGLEKAFRLRDELKGLPQADTIVCRCEDVTYGQLLPYDSSRAAKLQTRCGMGPCQGRICGPALAFSRGWLPDSVRPPVCPSALGILAGFEIERA